MNTYIYMYTYIYIYRSYTIYTIYYIYTYYDRSTNRMYTRSYTYIYTIVCMIMINSKTIVGREPFSRPYSSYDRMKFSPLFNKLTITIDRVINNYYFMMHALEY
jgi:hypothetical protein